MEYINFADQKYYNIYYIIITLHLCCHNVCVLFFLGKATGENSLGAREQKLDQSVSGVTLEGAGSAVEVGLFLFLGAKKLLFLCFLALHWARIWCSVKSYTQPWISRKRKKHTHRMRQLQHIFLLFSREASLLSQRNGGEHPKQIWGVWFAFSWLLRGSGQSSGWM